MKPHEITLKEIGAHIKRSRIEKNICQEYLGKKVGLSKSTISRLENGERDTTIHKLLMLSEHLGINPKELFE